ncbi:GntR family transcriptional regulator [Phaeovulum vinaykumarii]|uniref:Transcriptional regulator, GntR family n=1 Tax=Phaeovulum vinaykumarii TaxID=407234 RepID=A0A1N7M8F6_9RHOB|nr:GntR family transcriptional regulator [Phaeovulum vinaykumarii]SIS82357.1 transcriptional regulator, GntR family [Phaeovulum vinaykumarii]SOC11037.1 GntR family transcriptional regulator [Phaeovulum vinaykumarii]
MSSLTLPQQIADRLRRAILTGALPPGASIKERDQAAEMGVSRTPMREAIRILAQEGLVTLRPARSPLVAHPSLKEVTDDLAVLRVLEMLACERALETATPEQVAQVTGLHERMVEISDTADPLDFFETDMAFHRAIVSAADNPALAETHSAYLARLWRSRFLSARMRSDRARVLRQHGDIARGLATRNRDLMLGEAAHHLERLEDNIRHFFETGEEERTQAAARA